MTILRHALLSTDSGQTFAGCLPYLYSNDTPRRSVLEEEDHCKRRDNIVALPPSSNPTHSLSPTPALSADELSCDTKGKLFLNEYFAEILQRL